MSEQSEQINELATALAKAQGRITGALKDSANPFFKSKYADLAACWDACRQPLSENGLSVIQVPESDETGVTVVTVLAHSSGQWIRSSLHMKPKDTTPQGVGSAITYARRYALAAFVGLAQVDDDGNAASGKGKSDPRGEPEHRDEVDEKQVDKYVSLFTDALNCDVEEDERARMVSALRAELAGKNDLFIAVGYRLEPKQKSAIRLYCEQHTKAMKENVSGRRG